MKIFLKLCMPPILWNGVRRLFVKESCSLTYTGTFATFSEVASAFPEPTSYRSEESMSIEIAAADERLRRYCANEAPECGPTQPRLNFLPTLLSLTPNLDLSVLDVGGGLGVLYFDLKFSLPTKQVVVTVLELPDVVEAGQEIFHKFPDLRFVGEFPQTKGGYDVVYFGSSLQYFEAYVDVLSDAAHLSPEYIVIADTTMGPASSFVCAQVNMPGQAIPRIVFNRGSLIQTLAELGYFLVHQTINFSETHTFQNYAPPAMFTEHWNLVFRRGAGSKEV